MAERIEAVFTGRVQGVGFRWSVVGVARELPSVTGWVRNEPDGTVRLVAEGDGSALAALTDAILARWQTHLTSHQVTRSAAVGDLPGFSIAR